MLIYYFIGVINNQKFIFIFILFEKACENPDEGKVACTHCNKLLKFVSLSSHLDNHCQVLKQIEIDKELEKRREVVQQQEKSNPLFTNSGRIIRKAAAG